MLRIELKKKFKKKPKPCPQLPQKPASPFKKKDIIVNFLSTHSLTAKFSGLFFSVWNSSAYIE